MAFFSSSFALMKAMHISVIPAEAADNRWVREQSCDRSGDEEREGMA